MNTFYIVRHGETENNRARRLSGQIDTPLTPNGLVPTLTVIAKLQNVPLTVVYSSDLGRAFITAYTIVRALDFTDEVVRLRGIREVAYGDASNMLRTEAYAQYPGLDSDTNYTPPNGESLANMQVRILTAIRELDDAHADATILVVAHSGVMAALHSSFTGQDFGKHNITEEYPHDYVGRFTITDGKLDSFAQVL
jgi:broad specificity phosphatase PhoE